MGRGVSGSLFVGIEKKMVVLQTMAEEKRCQTPRSLPAVARFVEERQIFVIVMLGCPVGCYVAISFSFLS
jgi:hypothetical protein